MIDGSANNIFLHLCLFESTSGRVKGQRIYSNEARPLQYMELCAHYSLTYEQTIQMYNRTINNQIVYV